MQNIEKWKCTKFDMNKGKLIASMNTHEVMAGSWLISQYVADFYNDTIPKYVNGRLLDIGCGTVPLYGLYKDYIYDSVCVDWENAFSKNPHIDYEMDISKPLNLETESFDTVICSDVLEHIYNPLDTLNEIVRVCKRGGIILVNTPFSYWIHAQPYDYNRYTRFFYEKYANETENIELLDLRNFGSAKSVLMDMIGKTLSSKAEFMTRWLQKIVYRASKKSKRITHEAWTLGYGVVLRKI